MAICRQLERPSHCASHRLNEVETRLLPTFARNFECVSLLFDWTWRNYVFHGAFSSPMDSPGYPVFMPSVFVRFYVYAGFPPLFGTGAESRVDFMGGTGH